MIYAFRIMSHFAVIKTCFVLRLVDINGRVLLMSSPRVSGCSRGGCSRDDNSVPNRPPVNRYN